MIRLPAPWPRFVLAAVTGSVWALSYPLPEVAGLAWAAPGLLLATTAGAGRGLAFRAGYLAGLVHYLVSLSWLRHIPFPAGAYAGWFTLSLFLALGPPLWALGCWRFARVVGLFSRGESSSGGLPDRWSTGSWWRLNAWLLLCAAAWVAWEMVLARLFGGFPWNLLGASQYRMLPVIQVASFAGVYGVSFVMVWFSASLFVGATTLARHPDRTAAWRRPIVFPALILVAVSGGGFLTILGHGTPPKRLNLALVQPSIPQTVIFDPDASGNRFEALLRLTEQALTTGPDLVVWPEASLPGGLSREDFEQLARRIRDARTWLIFGSDEVEEEAGAEPGAAPRFKAYNSAFLLGPDGEVAASYRKRRLVIFGEFIPFGRWFPFLQRLAPIGDGFHPGTAPAVFRLGETGVATSPLICFEDNFPQQAREHAGPGIDLLVNLTNDAWFGRSAAQWQHNANAVFRAVENGIPLVRCCNNGISCWIDPVGRIHSNRIREGRDVYEPGFESLVLAYGSEGTTLYRRFGDVFGWTCVLATLLGCRITVLRRLGPPFLRSRLPRTRESADQHEGA